MPKLAKLGLSAVLLVGSIGTAWANEEWPRETKFEGPLKYCSYFFATEVPAGETVTVRDPGLDFTVAYFETGDVWLGVYEGNHPQTDDRKTKRVRLIPDLRVERMTTREGGTSYVIEASRDEIPVYLHVFGNAFTGAEADGELLARFAVGDFGKTGCEKTTYLRA